MFPYRQLSRLANPPIRAKQGPEAWQRSSNAGSSGLLPKSMKLLILDSFSLVRFFWRSNKHSDSLRQLNSIMNEIKEMNKPGLAIKLYESMSDGNSSQISIKFYLQ